MQFVLLSVPSKPRQSKTQIIGAEDFHLAQTLRRQAPLEALRQDPRPFKGRLPPSHRKAHPAPSSGKARGLSPGGPLTLPRS